MTKTFLASMLAVLILVSASARFSLAEDAVKPVLSDDKPHIDIVFCIDCSGSMHEVIETAKIKVWSIVNEVARAKPSPVLRIGLIGYGSAAEVDHQLGLTEDLDEVYKQLMTFTDNAGGDEYVGLMVHNATANMQWSQGSKTLKIIYVVGNETARQGPEEFDYAKTSPQAIAKGIIVNAIYCGSTDYDSATPTWREMAKLADGQYLEIAADGGAVVVQTPFDDKLIELNKKLNATYISYGKDGLSGRENQVEQDENAAKMAPSVAAERAQAKGSMQYNNARWDLVDAAKDKAFDLKKLEATALPEEMQKMSAEEREAYVKTRAQERAAVQDEIAKVGKDRQSYIDTEVKKQGLTDGDALDKAVRDSLNTQAKEKGFKFDE